MTTIASQSNIGFPTYNTQTSSTNESTKLNNSETVEKTLNNSISTQVNEKRQLSNQEVASLYFNRQATQLTKDLINIYADVQLSQNEVTLRDINEFQRKSNRNEFIENVDKENIDKSELIDIIKSEKSINSQEAAAIYFKHQNNELTQNKIDIYSSVESQNESTDNSSNEISYQDINDIYKQQNRSEFIQNLNSNKETLHF